MTPLLMAHVFNVLSGSVLLGFSLIFLRRYPSAFFRAWTTGFAFSMGYVATAALASFWNYPLGLRLLASTCVCVAAAWAFRAAALLRGRAPALWQRWVAWGGFAASIALTLAGVPYLLAAVPAAIANSTAVIWLGAVLLRDVRTSVHPQGIRWLGWPLIFLGALPIIVPFPLVMAWGVEWIGFGLAGALQAVIAIGMLLYLAEEHWTRELMEQRKLNRLKVELVAMIAHEMRTPLTSILGYVEFLDESALDEEQAGFVRYIEQSTRRIQRLLGDLTDFAPLDGGALRLRPSAIEADTRTRAVVEALSPMAKLARVTVECEVSADPLTLHADAERFDQVITNLVSNAIKFTPAGGQVRLAWQRDGGDVRFEIRDSGLGIPEEKLPRVFDKFYQDDAQSPERPRGTGLGLAIAKAIVEAHGGRIGVASTPGTGSTFWFTMPHQAAP